MKVRDFVEANVNKCEYNVYVKGDTTCEEKYTEEELNAMYGDYKIQSFCFVSNLEVTMIIS